jgi:hypothetical protein
MQARLLRGERTTYCLRKQSFDLDIRAKRSVRAQKSKSSKIKDQCGLGK